MTPDRIGAVLAFLALAMIGFISDDEVRVRGALARIEDCSPYRQLGQGHGGFSRPSLCDYSVTVQKPGVQRTGAVSPQGKD
jgi:hypothetical protein